MEPRLPQYTQFFITINALFKEKAIELAQRNELEQNLLQKEARIVDIVIKYASRDMEQQLREKLINYVQNKQKEPSIPFIKNLEKIKSNKFSLSARQISFQQDDPIIENKQNSLSTHISQLMEQLETALSIHKNNEGQFSSSDLAKMTSLRDQINKCLGTGYEFELDNESPVRCRNISVCGGVIQEQNDDKSDAVSVQLKSKYHLQMIEQIKQTYLQLKNIFIGSLHTHQLLMQEELSYNNLVSVVKSMIKELTDSDEIYFLIKRNSEWDFYSTEKDSIKQVDKVKQQKFFINFNHLKPNIVYNFKSDSPQTQQLEQLKHLLDLNSQFIELSAIRFLTTNKQETFFFFYWKKPGEDVLLRKFINEANEYGFKDEVLTLTNFLIDVIIQARVQYFNPVQFADQIQDIALSFVESSQYILIDEIKRALETHFRVRKDQAFSEDGREKIEADSSLRIEMECRNPITLIIDQFYLNRQDHQYIYTKILKYKYKFQRYLRMCHEKTAYYKYFLRSSDTILFDFDRRGKLLFLNHSIWEALKQKYNISFSPDQLTQNYKDLFTDERILKCIDLDEFVMKKRNQYTQHEDFEIFLKVVDQEYKGFVIIFHLQEGSRMKDYIKSLKNDEYLEDEIQQSIQRSYNKHQTQKFIYQLQKSNPTVNNSQIALFIPEENAFSNSDQTLSTSIKMRKPRLSIQLLGKTIKAFTCNSSKSRIKSIESALEIEEDDDLDLLYQDQTIDTFEFNVLGYQNQLKIKIVYNIIMRNDWIDNYDINQAILMKFIREVERKYNKRHNPFHNFDHGVTVMQSCHFLCLQPISHLFINEIVHFATVISGLCHDISHTGRTNQFEINSRSKLAIRYLDKSPLENHHAAVTLRLLNSKDFNILSGLKNEDLLVFRSTIIDNILYTDIKQHFSLLKDFEQRVKEGKENQEKTFGTLDNDIKLLTGMIVHTSDFSGAAKTFTLSRTWTEKVNTEFKAQYEEEGQKNIAQTPFLKDLDKQEIMAKNEMGFFKVIVRPLWASLNDFYDKTLEGVIDNVENTIISWEKIYHKYVEEEKKN